MPDDLRLDEDDLRILQATADGLTAREIAAAVYMSEGSIKNRRHRMCARFGVTNSPALVAAAFRRGLVE